MVILKIPFRGGTRRLGVMASASVALFVFLLGFDPRFVRGFSVLQKDYTVTVRNRRGRIRIPVAMMSAVSPIAMPVPVVPVPVPDCEQDERGICDGGEQEQEQDARNKANDRDGSLLCPSACPSKTYGASNIKVSYQPIETDDPNADDGVHLLPLQKHHARTRTRTQTRTTDQRNKGSDNTGSIMGKVQTVRHDIPSLEFISDNLSRFSITKSSQVMLEDYVADKKSYLEQYPSSDGTIDDFTTVADAEESSSNPDQQHEHKQRLLLKKDRLRSKIRAECRASLPLVIEETLKILYCDSHICVVDKPSGVLSVPGHRRNPSLADLVYDTIEPSSYDTEGSIDNIDQSVVHRLDMATSGIIVYALSKEALSELHVTFRDRKVQKTYQALVEGHVFLSPGGEEKTNTNRTHHNPTTGNHHCPPPPFGCCGTTEGEIDVALERDPNNPPYMRIAQTRLEQQYNDEDDDGGGEENNNNNSNSKTNHKFWREAPKPSKTTWSILSYEHDSDGRPVTRIELLPHTGRTHQLRVHTSQALGAPIVGDEIYGNGDGKAPLCLHARQLCLRHPISGAAMVFEADPPF